MPAIVAVLVARMSTGIEKPRDSGDRRGLTASGRVGILDFLWFSDVVSDAEEAQSAAVSGRSSRIRFCS